ncbi:MAG: ABC transporter permease, partial [Ruminococcus sp.]|nr:ABC transporter permease [Ruminococcus sp.]
NCVEDGEFSVFLPLTDRQISNIEDKGVEIEEMFSFDYTVNESVLRIMKLREKINLIEIRDGKLPSSDNETVLEQRYADENVIKTGDTVKIGDTELIVSGLGSVPDYDMPLKKISDSAVESSTFGIAFVTSSMYDSLASGNAQKAQEYTYSYRLGNSLSADELKHLIQDMDFDYHNVDDVFFQEYISDFTGLKDNFSDGIQELADGSEKLRDGLSELNNNSGELMNGANGIFDKFIGQANASLSALGVDGNLSADNYAAELDKYISVSDSNELKELKSGLALLEKYINGTEKYTGGVSDAYDGSEELTDGIRELQSNVDEIVEKYFDVQPDNLTMFMKAENNPRISAASNERLVNRNMGLLAGVVVMILFMYVISVFVVHQIQSESSVIGVLYAMGIKKKELISHYLMLPVVIALLGGIVGALIGFSSFSINSQMSMVYSYYSIPDFRTVYPLYLIIYCVVMPPVTAVVVNYIVINNKLSKTALSLMRNERKENSISNINLNKFSFIRSFQIRQIFRELRIVFTVIFGMFISMLIFMIGMNSFTLCTNVRNETQADTKYNYMYYLKYPEKEMSLDGEAMYTETLSKEYLGYSLDVNIFGIDNDNKYFDADVVSGKNNIVISKSVQQKYSLSIGDKFVLFDETNDMDYAFNVMGIADYSAGLAVFMDIKSMRELFGQEDDFYNTILSDNMLDIKEGRLYSVTTKEDIKHSSEVFLSLMRPTQIMLISVSIIIFFIVMYLMLKVMIDRCSFGISLVKIFGYRINEAKKLYLNGYMFVTAFGAVVCIPLAKFIADKIYPNIISNTACGVNISFPVYVYPCIFAGVMAVYFIVITFLVSRLKKISPVEVLKNRE